MKTYLIFLVLFFSALTIQGQENKFKYVFRNSESDLVNEEYHLAVEKFEELLTNDPSNANVNYLLGYCLMKSGGDINEVINLLEFAEPFVHTSYRDGSYKERNAPISTHFYLGRAYHLKNQFDYAIDTYERYRSMLKRREKMERSYVNAHIMACERAKEMINYPLYLQYQPVGENLKLNTDITNPVISGDNRILIFFTERYNVIHIMETKWQGDVWSDPKEINSDLDLIGEVVPVSLSYDGSELYLVSDNVTNKDIYVSHHNGSNWSKAHKLNRRINSRYNETHAAISSDGQTLVFTSDRNRGVGNLDIYYARRLKGDKWDKPINLGSSINTKFNEDTPFLTNKDNTLYFSSEGHFTMGGFDIFISNWNQEGFWEPPQNIGYPISTSGDDLFFNPGWDGSQPLLATHGDNSGGHRELYYVQISENAPTADRENPAALMPVKFSAPANPPNTSSVEKRKTNLELSEVAGSAKIPEESSSALEKYHIVNTIFFKFNEFEISDQSIGNVRNISKLLEENPDIHIELTGHSDSKGTFEYNLKLSEKRAQTVADFLVSEGLDKQRILLNAAGESDPIAINQYGDGVDAPEGRKLNRNVSLRFLNANNDEIKMAKIEVPSELASPREQGYTILIVQSSGRITSLPEVLFDKQVTLVDGENSFLYTLGNFPRREAASELLKQVKETGYPDASIVERSSLEKLSSNRLLNPECFTIEFKTTADPGEPSTYKDLNMVIRYKCRDGLYRFVSGEFARLEDAQSHLQEVVALGYTDSLVMPCSRYKDMLQKSD